MGKYRIAALLSLVLAVASCGTGSDSERSPEPTPAPSAPTPGTPSSSAPSSESLIDDALSKGQIDDETALKFKVFAAFADARLPVQFKGDDGGVFETDALWTLAIRFDSLSSENQLILGPFLLRPSDSASWVNGGQRNAPLRAVRASRPACDGDAIGWAAFDTRNAKARVWYQTTVPGDFGRAQVVADAIDNEIWPELISGAPSSVGFKEPLDDSSLLGCYGGDSRLDVYLVQAGGFRGLAQPEGLLASVRKNPVYIMLNTTQLASNDELKAGAAHEIMHAIQFAYEMKSPQGSYGWMRDAMANWAIDQVYKKGSIQLEQEYADCFTSAPALSLDDTSLGHCTKWPSAGHEYGAYLFFQYIAHATAGGASVVRQSLEATVTNATSLEAVDSSIPGGFKDQWWKFAKTLWNQDPIDAKPESFKQWDGLNDKPKDRTVDGDLKGAPEAKEPLETDQNSLSSSYYHFTFKDPNTRSILFYNGFYDQIKAGKAIKIIAMWKDASGLWQEEDPSATTQDWTQYKFVGLCRDIKIQRASELVIIVSNGEKEPGGKVTASQAPYLKRSNMGCFKYEGQATFLVKEPGWSGLGRKAVSQIAFSLASNRTALDARNAVFPNSLRVGLGLPLFLSGTSRSFQIDYTEGGCTHKFGPVSLQLATDAFTTTGTMFTNPFPEIESIDPTIQNLLLSWPLRGYGGKAFDQTLVDGGTVTGKDCIPGTGTEPIGPLFFTGGDPLVGTTFVAKPDGSFEDVYVEPGSNAIFDWKLLPMSE